MSTSRAEAGVAAAALDGAPLSGPFPVAPASARAAVRNNVAAVQRRVGHAGDGAQPGDGRPAGHGHAPAHQRGGRRLTTSYQGTELISQSGVDGSVKMISQVWHQGGGMTLVETSDGTTVSRSRGRPAISNVASSDPVSGSPEGVFGVTKSLVALLGKHYVAVYRGGGAAVGRAATVVELYRFDGSLAARYWLDKQTMVPLRRELFDTSDNVISEDSFVQVKFGALAAPPAGRRGRQRRRDDGAARGPVGRWVATASPATFATSLNEQGWQVPGSLPGGLPLYTAASAKTTSGEVVDLEYSDGLYVVSLFVQRGTLAANMAGWQQARVAGQQAFVSGHSVTWAGPGFVYTVIADAPPETVTAGRRDAAAQRFARRADRLGRGFMRLASVINPFG